MIKTIEIEKLSEIGYVKKTHGINGELLINYEEGFESIFEEQCFVFIEADGLPVPFYTENIEMRENSSALVRLRFIGTKEIAQKYVGAKVYAILTDEQSDADNYQISKLKGFTLSDHTQGTIGQIAEIDDYNGNIVMSVKKGKKELLLPLNEDLITAFDASKKAIEMDFPQGLFDLDD